MENRDLILPTMTHKEICQVEPGSTSLQAEMIHCPKGGPASGLARGLSTSGLQQRLAREGVNSCFWTEVLGKGETNCQGHAEVFLGTTSVLQMQTENMRKV